MCGIFGYIGDKNTALQIVLEGLKRLEYRGYDSWGIAYAKPKLKDSSFTGSQEHLKLKRIRDLGKIADVQINDVASKMALGHTRWATHGGVTIANTHPHLDCKGRIGIVHNGIIENFQELKQELQKKDHKFTSQTDTEIAAHKIEDLLLKNLSPLEAMRKAFIDFEGRNAIIGFFPEQEELVVAKNGSPIVIGKGKSEYYIASDAVALLLHTRNILFLNDSLVASISYKGVRLVSLKSGRKRKIEWQKLNWKPKEAKKGVFKYFYLKEVMDQRHTIVKTISQDEKVVREFAKAIRQSYGTYFIGAGSAYYACLLGAYIFSKIAGRHVNTVSASEFPYIKNFIRADSLVVGISQSGETADLLEAIDSARDSKARIGAIVNVFGSCLYRISDIKFPLRAGPERSVLATKSFTSMLAAFYLLAFTLIGEYKQGKRIMLKLGDSIDKFLGQKQLLARIKKIADALGETNHVFTLGRGLSFPVALEAALKIKEASYIHAEGFAGGELKHGVIALVEKKTPFIAFVAEDETKKDIISNIIEVKSRGAYIIAVAKEDNKIFDELIEIPDVGQLSPIISIIPMQLLAYYLTISKGLDPDKPRNLAKSVTVK